MTTADQAPRGAPRATRLFAAPNSAERPAFHREVVGPRSDPHRRSGNLPAAGAPRQTCRCRARGVAQPALLRRADGLQPAADARAGRPSGRGMDAPGWRRCRPPRPPLTRLPPDRESGRTTPRGRRHSDGHRRLRPGYRRGVRGAALPVRGFSPRQSLWQAVGRGDAIQIVGGALELLERAWLPRTTVQRPETWAQGEADARWRERFMWVGDDNRAALAQAGEARRRTQAAKRPGSGELHATR